MKDKILMKQLSSRLATIRAHHEAINREMGAIESLLEKKVDTSNAAPQSCLTKKHVAERLNVSLRKVDYMIEAGEIVGFKIGKSWRMKAENLERWIEKKQVRW